jgi:hypothetical protein
MNKSQIKFIPFDTYLAMIKNSVGGMMFRNVYAKIGNKKIDITENGNLSCAVFVSSILYLCKFINDVHANIDSTVKDLKKSGWKEIKKPKLGCVLVWAEKDFGNSKHKHIGFFIGGKKAVSNNSQYGYPTEHNWKEYDGRKVELILSL